MQRTASEQPHKRPRREGEPRTPPNTPSAAAARDADPELPSDGRTWNAEQVCCFLKRNGFKDSALLDRFRGSGAVGWRERGPEGRRPEAGTAGLREGALGQ